MTLHNRQAAMREHPPIVQLDLVRLWMLTSPHHLNPALNSKVAMQRQANHPLAMLVKQPLVNLANPLGPLANLLLDRPASLRLEVLANQHLGRPVEHHLRNLVTQHLGQRASHPLVRQANQHFSRPTTQLLGSPSHRHLIRLIIMEHHHQGLQQNLPSIVPPRVKQCPLLTVHPQAKKRYM